METLALLILLSGVGMLGCGIGCILLVTAYGLLVDIREEMRLRRRVK